MRDRRGARAGVALTTAALLVAVGCSEDATDDAASEPGRSTRGEHVAVPTVRGPIEGGVYELPFNPAPRDLLEEHGYTEEEYVIEGTATSYLPDGTWGEDGEWAVREDASAGYATRILVRRPVDPDAFDGTVTVEWLNVTAGMDADPDWGFVHEELARRGAAWVGVSAQRVGVEGGGGIVDVPGLEIRALKEWDPTRYAGLDHPGDEYSFNIFSQAAQALLRPDGVDPLEGLDPVHLVAMGESQSAARLVTYVNAVHPVADVYDGFMIHSRGRGAAAVHEDVEMPEVVFVRTDLSDPVMIFQTETDLFGLLGSADARQPDTDTIVTWEVAGTAHADVDTLEYGIRSGSQWNPDERPDFVALCGGPLNEGGQQYTLRAALASLVEWVAGASPPAAGAPIETVIGSDGEEEVARDGVGNALGGVRTPFVDVPIATYSGEPRPDSSILCSLFGSTTPFTTEQLQALYPTHEDYVREVSGTADALVAGGFLLEVDRDRLVADADASDVPGAEAS